MVVILLLLILLTISPLARACLGGLVKLVVFIVACVFLAYIFTH
jgi:hypothetical protein